MTPEKPEPPAWQRAMAMAIDGPDLPRSQLPPRAGEPGLASDGSREPPAGGGEPPDLPEIRIVPGEIGRMVAEAEAALSAAPPMIFSRGNGTLVRPGNVPVETTDGTKETASALHPQSSTAINGVLSERIKWTRFAARQKKWVRADPPRDVSAIIAARRGQWRLPKVTGTICCPTLRPDGSLLSEFGYDRATGLFCTWRGGDLGLSGKVSRVEAEESLDDLSYLLREFAFVNDVDRAVALSALITPVTRGAFDVAPMHGITAPAAGSGKSFLVDLAALIATGRRCAVVGASSDEIEAEKRLASCIIAGLPLISLDNLNGELRSDLLCQAVSQPTLLIRLFQTLENAECENRACFFATGNGLTVSGDLLRRTIIASLDSAAERPELREFENNPFALISRERSRYILAAIKIVLAFQASGERPLPALNGFEGWSSMVRSALVWLGERDPASALETSRAGDPELHALRAFLDFARESFGSGSFSVADVICLINSSHGGKKGYGNHFEDDDDREQMAATNQAEEKLTAEHRELLLSIAGIRGVINGKRLSTWLAKNERRILAGFRIEKRAPDSHSKLLRFIIAKV